MILAHFLFGTFAHFFYLCRPNFCSVIYGKF